MALQRASPVRAAAFRSQCLSLAKNFSIGLRSGEYLGREEELCASSADGFFERPFPCESRDCRR
jgi:hypothetical protein